MSDSKKKKSVDFNNVAVLFCLIMLGFLLVEKISYSLKSSGDDEKQIKEIRKRSLDITDKTDETYENKDTINCFIENVVDGDTLRVSHNGSTLKVRMAKIDAPELSQAYGYSALNALSRMLPTYSSVTIKIEGKDRYGRIIGTVINDSGDINKQMVQNGHAWHYKKYSDDSSYDSAEASAKSLNKGLWESQIYGENPVAPWDYRKKR